MKRKPKSRRPTPAALRRLSALLQKKLPTEDERRETDELLKQDIEWREYRDLAGTGYRDTDGDEKFHFPCVERRLRRINRVRIRQITREKKQNKELMQQLEQTLIFTGSNVRTEVMNLAQRMSIEDIQVFITLFCGIDSHTGKQKSMRQLARELGMSHQKFAYRVKCFARRNQRAAILFTVHQKALADHAKKPISLDAVIWNEDGEERNLYDVTPADSEETPD